MKNKEIKEIRDKAIIDTLKELENKINTYQGYEDGVLEEQLKLWIKEELMVYTNK